MHFIILLESCFFFFSESQFCRKQASCMLMNMQGVSCLVTVNSHNGEASEWSETVNMYFNLFMKMLCQG